MTKPLYQQIIDDLKQKIESHEWHEHSKVPTEKELSAQYQVSRITSKRALNELEAERLIYRVQGKGSFVRPYSEQQHKTPNPPLPNEASKRILFILPFADNMSVGDYTKDILQKISQQGRELFIANRDYLASQSVSHLKKDFLGMIYYPENVLSYLDLIYDLYLADFPIVLIDKKIYELPQIPAVTADNFYGGYLATNHLIELGHREISFVFGSSPSPDSVKQRYLGYLNALAEHDITQHTRFNHVKKLAIDESTHSANYRRVLSKKATAAICENDLVAIQLMKEARHHQQYVPNQLSIVGFDDIQAAALVDPSLTTIAQNFSEMGKIAYEVLQQLIDSKTQSATLPSDQKIPVKLVARESTTLKIETNTKGV